MNITLKKRNVKFLQKMVECYSLCLAATSIEKRVIKPLITYFHALRFVLDCHKPQKLCNKAVSTYPSAIKFVPEC